MTIKEKVRCSFITEKGFDDISKNLKEAYKQGAMDAIEATTLVKLVMDKDSPHPINYGVSTFNLAVEEQENKAEQFLDSLKDNSGSEIPTDSSD